MKRPELLALSVVATGALLSGCSDTPNINKPIRMPEGYTDLGPTTMQIDRGTYQARAFLVSAQAAGEASCGSIIKYETEYPSRQETRAVDGEHVQINCSSPGPGYASLQAEDLAAFKALPVEIVATHP